MVRGGSVARGIATGFASSIFALHKRSCMYLFWLRNGAWDVAVLQHLKNRKVNPNILVRTKTQAAQQIDQVLRKYFLLQ